MSEANGAVAAELLEIAALLTAGRAERFKARAFRQAGRMVAALPIDITALSPAERHRLDGVGPAVGRVIEEHLETGTSGYAQRLREGEPSGFGQLVQVMGVSTRVARALAGRGVTDLEGLSHAVDDGSILQVEGVGARTAEVIADGLRRLDPAAAGRPVLRQARLEALTWARRLRGLPEVADVEIAGDVRRGVPQPTAVELLCLHDPDADPDRLVGAVLDQPGIVRPLPPPPLTVGDAPAATAHADETHPGEAHTAEAHTAEAHTAEVHAHEDADGRRVDALTSRGQRLVVHLTPPERAGTALVVATGSRAHVHTLRQRGMAAGAPDEAAAYRSAGMDVTAPPLREVDAPPIPDRLVELGDLRGDCHVHTEWSGDGHDSIDELARAARARGYDWLALTDHAEDLTMNGLTREELRRRDAAIEEARERHPDLTLLRGLELNIGLDGGVDYDLDTLLGQEWCIASIHSVFQRPEQVQTDRILAAIGHPAVDAIGHPVGRLLGMRPGYAIDLAAIAEAAAETGTALEVNGSPRRLDLDAELVAIAVAAGAPLVLDSDAHRARELDYVVEAVLTAQRGGAPLELVRNAGDPPTRPEAAARRRS